MKHRQWNRKERYELFFFFTFYIFDVLVFTKSATKKYCSNNKTWVLIVYHIEWCRYRISFETRFEVVITHARSLSTDSCYDWLSNYSLFSVFFLVLSKKLRSFLNHIQYIVDVKQVNWYQRVSKFRIYNNFFHIHE